MDLSDRHAIVTGGSSGIGRATARLLAQQGAHVSIVARRQEQLDETVAELEALGKGNGQRFHAVSADVADWEQIKEAMDVLVGKVAVPDILINAAGFAQPGYFQDLPLGVFRSTMDVDFFGVLHAIKAVLPAMMERRSGHIVNFSSIAGFVGLFGYTAYGAAKFAVRGFSDALRQEMRLFGIHVAVVFPPNTDTPGLEQENRCKPLEVHCLEGQARALTADQVARAVVRGIERKKAYILPSLDAQIYFLFANGLNGMTGFFRWLFMDRIVDRVQRQQGARAR
jgi:3-dehydrosphinganine reductase